ncbi:MAG TPA: SUMF1/EgtB/PvdO family nonheme iron enzyme [Polyangiaceae bacterium]|nr:SUMF1/EgtB/PvdO family nonheme iron enzyme [Polyangiaceae bacterium]
MQLVFGSASLRAVALVCVIALPVGCKAGKPDGSTFGSRGGAGSAGNSASGGRSTHAGGAGGETGPVSPRGGSGGAASGSSGAAGADPQGGDPQGGTLGEPDGTGGDSKPAAGASGAVAGECESKKSGATFCRGLQRLRCDSVGEEPVVLDTCEGQACVDGECVGECEPGQDRCALESRETCGSDGAWQAKPCPDATPLCKEGACVAPPSCSGLSESCGVTGSDACCSSLAVPGGTFYRSYDGVEHGSQDAPALVADFRLDKYEVTVGRFKRFMEAWTAGFRPADGSGKHSHLNQGKGLLDVGANGMNELGWDPEWAASVSVAEARECDDAQTLLSNAANDSLPMNCINWYEAYAFCIWDGGFLPSEAEWNYAASGGEEQRVYPWSKPANSTNIACSFANYTQEGYTVGCTTPPKGSPTWMTGSPNRVGSESPFGDGKYGHAGLAGNVAEWVLDWSWTYGACTNCARTTAAANDITRLRVARGGDAQAPQSSLQNGARGVTPPSSRIYSTGVRCARTL